MKIAALLLLAFVAFLPLRAVEPATNAPVTNEALVAQHYREVAARPEYVETDDAAIDTRLKDWLSQWFQRLSYRIGNFKYASQMPAFESLLMSLLVLFSITVLFYVLHRLTRRRGLIEEEPSNEEAGSKAFRPPEYYDEEIRQAAAAGDWHAAWLATWRQFLSRLENRHLVDADRTRTNREYLAQLREKPLPGQALALLNAMVDAYDRFIYGRAPISEEEWAAFHRHVGETSLLLHLKDKRLSALNRESA